MNLIHILLNARSDSNARRISGEDRKARRRARPAVDGLERREVFTAGFVGPLSLIQVAAVSSASTTPPSTTTITQDQQGTAFGMQWRCTYDSQIGQYHLDIQGGQGAGNVTITRTKVGVQFNTTQYNASSGKFENVQVAGPALELNTWVKIRQFRNSGDPNLSLGTGLYRTLETTDRTKVSYVSTPNGQMKLEYSYDCVNNTGVLTVHNVKGSGRFVYTKQGMNLDPGDPKPDSPSANPVRGFEFTMQGGSDAYTGGIDVFVAGKANAQITVVVDHQGSGYYQVVAGN